MENSPKKHSTFWTFFIDKRPVAWLLSFGIILIGLFAGATLPREIQPEINIPFGSVATILPGANPEDIESLVTDPLEKEISSITDIKNLTSTSALGLSTILVEFEADADIDEKIQQLKDKVDFAKNELPEDASDPQVIKAEPNSTSIVTFSIIGNHPLNELSLIAEDVRDELEEVTGVSRIDIVGNQEKQITVTVDKAKAENFGISLSQVESLIKFSNYNLPVGIITTNQINYSVRIDNRFTALEDIRNIPVSGNLLLKDIATIEETLSAQNAISKLSVNGEKSQNTVSLQVFKIDGGNIIQIVDDLKNKIPELELPEGVEVTVSNDNSEFIRTDLGILTNSGIQTTILIIIILFLALGLVEGILAGLSIPLTLLATLAIMNIQGSTINSLTLFSLVIALGLVVDTAIVIMEGVHENILKGYSSEEAAKISVETYKWPLIAGTTTTVFAFFPMLLVSGILGEFLKALPLTISAALLSSIFISLTIIPSVTAKFLANRNAKDHKSILEPIFHHIGHFFSGLISKILQRKSYRVLTISLATILFIGSLTLPATGALKVELFPSTDVRFFIVEIETPKGLILEETEKITTEIEDILYQKPEIESFLTIIGSGQSQVATDIISFSQAGSSNLANITVNLKPESEREIASYDFAEQLRKEFKKFGNVKITVQEFSEGPPSDSPIALRLTGPDINQLTTYASQIKDIIETVEGTENVNTDVSAGLNEFKFTLDRNVLKAHNLNGIEVASTIRNIVQGVEASELKIGKDDLKIFVKYNIQEANNTPQLSIKDIENFEIATPQGYTVNLGQIADFELGEGFSSINHEDRDRIIKIRSDLKADQNVVEVTNKIETQLENLELAPGYNIRFGGDTEDIEQSFQELFQSMIVAVILIGFTLVLMFNSLRQPFIILMTLPLALIGVLPGLFAIGLALSFPAFLGVVALSGVVVNDAIVLIDRINQNRANGMEFKESISEAAEARLQPIIMTSVTTIIGILPLALTNEFWAGLGFALMFGLIAATPLTLIVIPITYHIFEKPKKSTKL